MKELLVNTLRTKLSPSLRYEVGKIAAWLRQQLSRACLWNWEIASIPHPSGIIYIGRKAHREAAAALLIANPEAAVSPPEGIKLDRMVLVSEMPFPEPCAFLRLSARSYRSEDPLRK